MSASSPSTYRSSELRTKLNNEIFNTIEERYKNRIVAAKKQFHVVILVILPIQ